MVVGGTQQVMLKVRFAEMQRSVSKGLSSSLALQGTGLGGDLGISAGNGTLNNSGAVNNAFGGGSIPAVNENNGAFLFGFNAGGLEVGVLLEALESRGVVRTLAEPNLTALSGQEAKFLAGGEYPVPGESDGGGVTIEFKPFGVELNFTPRVIDEDVIDFTDLNGQVPWLGDVPVLGSLFRSAEYARRQTELVIIVTPHLVTPTRGEALALPTDRVRPPTERELFLFGRVAAENAPTQGGAGEVARQDFSGSYGYVLED